MKVNHEKSITLAIFKDKPINNLNNLSTTFISMKRSRQELSIDVVIDSLFILFIDRKGSPFET